jgi:hypothetical protein
LGFVIPLQRRLNRKLESTEYNKFLQRKREMIAEIDADPVAIGSAEPHPVPHIEVPAGDLMGPWERQAKRREDESDKATINGWMGRTGGSSLDDLWTMKLLMRTIFYVQAHFRLRVLAPMLMGENFSETDSI